MKIFILSLLFIFSGSLWAQDSKPEYYQVAVVSCPDSVNLLDFFEGQVLRDLKYPETANFKSLLENISPFRTESAEQYKLDFDFFMQTAQISNEKESPVLRSSDTILKAPASCQYLVVLETDFKKPVYIYKQIWDRLSDSARAGLILNWAMAKEFYILHQQVPKQSIYFRIINSLIFANQLGVIPFVDLVNLIKETGLNSLRKQGVLIDLTKEIRIKDELLQSAYPLKGSIWRYQNIDVRLKADLVLFYPNGAVSSLRFENQFPIKTIGGVVAFSTPDEFTKVGLDSDKNPELYFYPNGQVRRGLTLEKSSFRTNLVDIKLAQSRGVWSIADSSNLHFFENGEIAAISRINGNYLFQITWLKLDKNSSLSWHDNFEINEFVSFDAFTLFIQDQKISMKGFVNFGDDGRLHCGFINQRANFLDQHNQNSRAETGEQVCFDENLRYLSTLRP